MPLFTNAVEEGNVVDKSGYHQCRNCSCRKTTKKGAYRDVTVELGGDVIHFYHQSAVVIEKTDGSLVIDSHGYRTSTTKERINMYLPAHWYVYQRNYVWYLENPDGHHEEFEDGMTIDP